MGWNPNLSAIKCYSRGHAASFAGKRNHGRLNNPRPKGLGPSRPSCGIGSLIGFIGSLVASMIRPNPCHGEDSLPLDRSWAQQRYPIMGRCVSFLLVYVSLQIFEYFLDLIFNYSQSTEVGSIILENWAASWFKLDPPAQEGSFLGLPIPQT